MTDDEASGYLGLNIHAVPLLIGDNLDHLKFVMSLDGFAVCYISISQG